MSRRKRYTRNLGRDIAVPLPQRTTSKWVRFEHETEPYGVFCYLSDAKEVLRPPDIRELEAITRWFDEHLDAPDKATLERFWFKSDAERYVDRARRLSAIVGSACIPIVERQTSRVPGKIVWEDEHQVAALTYRDTPQPRRKG